MLKYNVKDIIFVIMISLYACRPHISPKNAVQEELNISTKTKVSSAAITLMSAGRKESIEMHTVVESSSTYHNIAKLRFMLYAKLMQIVSISYILTYYYFTA